MTATFGADGLGGRAISQSLICARCGQTIGPSATWREMVDCFKVVGLHAYHMGCEPVPDQPQTDTDLQRALELKEQALNRLRAQVTKHETEVQDILFKIAQQKANEAPK